MDPTSLGLRILEEKKIIFLTKACLSMNFFHEVLLYVHVQMLASRWGGEREREGERDRERENKKERERKGERGKERERAVDW